MADSPCQLCEGRGFHVVLEPVRRTCPRCAGTGKQSDAMDDAEWYAAKQAADTEVERLRRIMAGTGGLSLAQADIIEEGRRAGWPLSEHRAQLVHLGGLIVAEVERIDREKARDKK